MTALTLDDLTSNFIRVTPNVGDDFLKILAENDGIRPMNGNIAKLAPRLGVGNRFRMTYAFKNPLTARPAVFVTIALTHDLPRQAQTLIGGRDLRHGLIPDTATAYSITKIDHPSTKDIKNIPLALLRRVREEITSTHDNIRQMVTLSPMPLFNGWIGSTLDDGFISRHMIGLPIDKICDMAHNHHSLGPFYTRTGGDPFLEPLVAETHEIERLAAAYLVHAKCTKPGKEHLPFDPTAQFHIGNGARLEAIRINGDLSMVGSRNSMHINVNYLYPEEEKRLANVARYRETGGVACSSAIDALLPS